MSLIHEALQKAESERRAGELPSLQSSTRVRPKRNTSLAMPLLLFAGVLIVAAAAYNNRTLIANSMPARSDKPVANAQTVGKPSDGIATALAPDPAIRESVAVKPNAVRAQKPTTVSAPSPIVAEPVKVARAPRPVESKRPPEVEATVPPTVEPNSEPTVTSRPIEPIAEVTIPAEPARMPEPQDDAAEPADSAPAPVTATGSVPYIFELPLETRQALPNLKVTMHVYNADPSKRFAIIDGKRINEGGVVGNELDMVEIQRDALMLKFRNERFLMPRLGR